MGGSEGLGALGGPLLVLLPLVAGLLLPRAGGGAPASDGRARVVDVRVDRRGGATRVVFELDAPARYAVSQRRAPRSAGEATDVLVHLGARGGFDVLTAVARRRVERRGGLVESLRMEPEGEGGVARLRLAARRVRLRSSVLGNPPRLVFDLSEAEPVQRAALPRRIEEPPEKRERREGLTKEPEEKRPSEPLALPLFGRPLVLGGDVELRTGFDGDRRLGAREDDRATVASELELELFYEATEQVSLFAETKYKHRWEPYREGGGGDRHGQLKRGESWLHLDELGGTPFGLQLGRQSVRDPRQWWWDEKLDSVRLHLAGDGLGAELALGQELAPEATDEEGIDPEQEDVLRLLGRASWRYARDHRLELFLLGQRDRSGDDALGRVLDEEREDEVDADLAWLGLRARGRFPLGELGRLAYWWDAGAVRGEERVVDFDDVGGGRVVVDEVAERKVRGFGTDAGLHWQSGLPGRPAFGLAYAFGSGDAKPEDEVVRAFRQTGLQDNDAAIAGETRLRYYGELLDPELSNLHVATAAAGVPLREETWLTLAYHYYHQVRATDFLRDARLRAEPEGVRRSLGHGLDLVLETEAWTPLRIEGVGSLFRAGPAFGERRGELAWGARLKLELGF